MTHTNYFDGIRPGSPGKKEETTIKKPEKKQLFCCKKI
jgi:hypothetical protein